VAFTCREISAEREAVFAVLADPATYPEWLIGNVDVLHIDDDWPSVGSTFRHRVGVGPLTITDITRVVDVVPGQRLRLDVRARPLVRGLADFRLVGENGTTVVMLEEEPNVRIIGELVRPIADPLTHLRNHRSLCNLAEVVEGRRAVRPATAHDDPGRPGR
jgi:uncharacterized protein YndB with AHSA1/START domain